MGTQLYKLSPGIQKVFQDLKVSVSPAFIIPSIAENISILNFFSDQVVKSVLKERSNFEKDNNSRLVKQEIRNIYEYSNNCRSSSNNINVYTINSNEALKSKRTGTVISQNSKITKSESMTHQQASNLNIAQLSTNRVNSVIGSLSSSMLNAEDRSTSNISIAKNRKHTLCQVFGIKNAPRNTIADIKCEPESLKDFDINILHKLAFGNEKGKESKLSKIKEKIRSQSILSLINDKLIDKVKKKFTIKPTSTEDKILKSKHKLSMSALPSIIPEFFQVSKKEMSESQLSFYIDTELENYRSQKTNIHNTATVNDSSNYKENCYQGNIKKADILKSEKSEYSNSPYLRTDIKPNTLIEKKIAELKAKIKFTSRDIKNINLYKKKFNYKSCDFNHKLILYSPAPLIKETEPENLPESMKFIFDFENKLANMLTSNADKKQFMNRQHFSPVAHKFTDSPVINSLKQQSAICFKTETKNPSSNFIKKKEGFSEILNSIKSLEKNRTASIETMIYTKQVNKRAFSKSKSIVTIK